MSRPQRAGAGGFSYQEPTDDEFKDKPNRKRSLDEPPAADDGRPRRPRIVGKPSKLDSYQCDNEPVPGGPGFTFGLGDSSVGGQEAERVLREVEVDESVLTMKGPFAEARRVVLFKGGRVVAAAIVEVQNAPSFSSDSFLDIPILAAERSSRQKGYGSVLYALIAELGISLGMKIAVISSTPESRRFWLRQGFHNITHCEPPVAAALRALAQSGARYGFFETTQMARSLPTMEQRGSLVAAAVRSVDERQPTSKGLTALQAAEALGYTDLPPGVSSIFLVDGAGKRVPVPHDPKQPPELRPVQVPLHRLQAFPTAGVEFHGVAPPGGWGDPSWGLRCMHDIQKGQVVLEVCGELLDEDQYNALPDKRFTVSLEGPKQRGKEGNNKPSLPPAYLDLRAASSAARLVRACVEAPNLELVINNAPVGGVLPSNAPIITAAPTPAAAAAMPPPPVPVPNAAAEPQPPASTLNGGEAAAPPPAPPTDASAVPSDPPPPPGTSAAASASEGTSAAEGEAAAATHVIKPPPLARRAYLVARHYIPAMVELTWEPLPLQRGGGRKSQGGGEGGGAQQRTSSSNAFMMQSATQARGAHCEVRQEEAGLRGAYFGANVVSPARADGLVQVQYGLIYESVHKDVLLTEWVRPRDPDSVRPKPPPPPDGFHSTLKSGDMIEVWFEAGWWPAHVVAPRGSHACEVGSEGFAALKRTVPSTQVRPRWRWVGNAWQMQAADKA